MQQKTWIDLLGRDTDYVHVDGCDIVRGFEECVVLWHFDTPEQAEASFDAWLREVIKETSVPPGPNDPPPGSWAAVARMMAANDDSGFDWDAWKDEMKERELYQE